MKELTVKDLEQVSGGRVPKGAGLTPDYAEKQENPSYLAECGEEIAAYSLATTGIIYSITAGPVAWAVAGASWILAARAADQCSEAYMASLGC